MKTPNFIYFLIFIIVFAGCEDKKADPSTQPPPIEDKKQIIFENILTVSSDVDFSSDFKIDTSSIANEQQNLEENMSFIGVITTSNFSLAITSDTIPNQNLHISFVIPSTLHKKPTDQYHILGKVIYENSEEYHENFIPVFSKLDIAKNTVSVDIDNPSIFYNATTNGKYEAIFTLGVIDGEGKSEGNEVNRTNNTLCRNICWTCPLPKSRCFINSPYGLVRDKGLHLGTDIKAAVGDTIVAAADGVIIEAKDRSGFGPTIIIQHGGVKTLYAHLSRYIKKSGPVRRGEPIGLAGNEGTGSRGPHLHFEYSPSEFVNNEWGYIGKMKMLTTDGMACMSLREDKPVITFPEDNYKLVAASGTNQFSVNWNAVNNATSYYIHVQTKNYSSEWFDARELVGDFFSGEPMSGETPQLTYSFHVNYWDYDPGHEWRYRIVAKKDNCTISDSTAWRKFSAVQPE